MIEIKVGNFLQEHIDNIVEYCNKNPNELEELQKSKFGVSYPFLVLTDKVPNGRQRYWKDQYAINGNQYRFCSEFGGSRKNSEGKTLSQVHGEKLYEYFKDINILLNKYKNEKIIFVVGDISDAFTNEQIDIFTKIAKEKELRYHCSLGKKYFQIYPKPKKIHPSIQTPIMS